jgi:electron transfer flavoprotein alpha subunit
MEIRIINDKCVGCRACLKACPFSAIDIINKKAVLNERCTNCGACISSCKFSAIIQIGEKKKKDFSNYNGILVFVEQFDNQVKSVSYELLSKGKELATKLNKELYAVVLGDKVSKIQDKFKNYGLKKLYVAEDAILKDFSTDAYVYVITNLICNLSPEIVLFGATHVGRDIAPRVANKLKTGLTADCTNLEIDENTKNLLQTRPAFGGNLMATILTEDTRPQISTVRSGVFPVNHFEDKEKYEIEKLVINKDELKIRTKVLSLVKETKKKVNLEDARIIIAGGRGVGSKENFDLLHKLAKEIDAEVGASRAAVDNGYIDHDHQVGQTGKTVRPIIYIACGISGAIQHLAGIEDANLVVAINKDETAAIMKTAHYAIVGDLFKVLPEVVSELKKYRK